MADLEQAHSSCKINPITKLRVELYGTSLNQSLQTHCRTEGSTSNIWWGVLIKESTSRDLASEINHCLTRLHINRVLHLNIDFLLSSYIKPGGTIT